MQDVETLLRGLKRPKLLVRAARRASAEFKRERHLPRILRGPVPAKRAAVLLRLYDLEAQQNALRKTRDASYSAARHVDLLMALMAEAQTAAGAAR